MRPHDPRYPCFRYEMHVQNFIGGGRGSKNRSLGRTRIGTVVVVNDLPIKEGLA